MEQDNAADVETVLAQHMVRVFQVHNLTAPQAKRLLEKVRVLVDVGEKGSLTRSTERPSLAASDRLRVPPLTEKTVRLEAAAPRQKREKGLVTIHSKARV